MNTHKFNIVTLVDSNREDFDNNITKFYDEHVYVEVLGYRVEHLESSCQTWYHMTLKGSVPVC
jgi:hypothetical protein